MDILDLVLTFDAERFALSCLVRNKSSLPLKLGKLNLANFRIKHLNEPDVFANAKISEHIPNSDGVIELSGGGSIVFDVAILHNFAFKRAGRYSAWAIYNSEGFGERFAVPSSGPVDRFCSLAALAPLRAVSNRVEFEMTNDAVEESCVKSSWHISMDRGTRTDIDRLGR